LALPASLTDAEPTIRAKVPWRALRRRLYRSGVNLRQGCSSSPPPHPPAELLLGGTDLESSAQQAMLSGHGAASSLRPFPLRAAWVKHGGGAGQRDC
ncbi:unnamed protein product, partial [Urochloa humidicola]